MSDLRYHLSFPEQFSTRHYRLTTKLACIVPHKLSDRLPLHPQSLKAKEIIGEVFTNKKTGKTELQFSIFNNVKVLNPKGWIYQM